jgi:hypothetical protein
MVGRLSASRAPSIDVAPQGGCCSAGGQPNNGGVRSFDDAREASRSRTGLATGAFSGAGLGLALSILVPGLGVPLVGGAIGALAGAWLGRRVARGVDLEEWDPGPGRPYVGAHAPDDDNQDPPAPPR